MRLTVMVSGKAHEQEGENLADILGRLGTNIESVILLKDRKVILEEDVADGDTIELVNVASGG